MDNLNDISSFFAPMLHSRVLLDCVCAVCGYLLCVQNRVFICLFCYSVITAIGESAEDSIAGRWSWQLALRHLNEGVPLYQEG